MTFPHIPFLEKNTNGYTGSTHGAIARFAGNPDASAYWDIGTGHYNNNVGQDSFGISRNNIPVLRYDFRDQTNYRNSTWNFVGDIVSSIQTGYASTAEGGYQHAVSKFIGMTPDAAEAVILIAPYTGNRESWRGISGKLYIHRGNAAAWNNTKWIDIAVSKAYEGFQATCSGNYNVYPCTCTYKGVNYIGVVLPRTSSMDLTFSGLHSGNCTWKIISKTECANLQNLNATSAFQVQGDIYATGAITAGAQGTSDKRLKKQIRNYDAIGLIKELPEGRSYYWNKKAQQLNSCLKPGVQQYGFLANELRENSKFSNYVYNIPETDYYGIDYNKFIPVITESVRQLIPMVENQDEKILRLEKRVSYLEKQLSHARK